MKRKQKNWIKKLVWKVVRLEIERIRTMAAMEAQYKLFDIIGDQIAKRADEAVIRALNKDTQPNDQS